MRMLSANIPTASVSAGAYNSAMTSLLGRVFGKTINSQTVYGPPLTKFIDVFTDTVGVVTPTMFYRTGNNNCFAISKITGGLATVAYYKFSPSTYTFTYQGYLTITYPNLAATTHTQRGFKVVDNSGSTGWQLFIATTGSVLVNGGLFMANNISATDFTLSGTVTIPMATGSGQKANYFLQDSGGLGVNNTTTQAAGLVNLMASANGSYNTKMLLHNGVAATHQYFAFDFSVTPNVADQATTINNQTTPYGSTSPSAYFQYPGSTMPWAANDQLIILTSAPTGFTASTATVQTPYFIRDIQLISGNYYFNLSATSGGAAIVPTSALSNMTVMRAFGIAKNLFSFKTGNLPALSGVLLNSNSENFHTPGNGLNSGSECVFFGTTTTFYEAKITDIVASATTLASLISATVAGSGSDITAPTAAFAQYSTSIDSIVYITNTSTTVYKKWVNSAITGFFGGLSDQWLENSGLPTVAAAMAGINSIDQGSGYLFLVGSTIGQRGVIFVDMYSDTQWGYSMLITSIIDSGVGGGQLRNVQTLEQLFDYTDSETFSVRSSNNPTDTLFSSASGGWTTVATAADLSSVVTGRYVQFRIQFDILTLGANTPAQVYDLLFGFTPQNDMSDNWQFDGDNSTQAAGSPAYSAFNLKAAYTGSVPTLYFRALDQSGNVVISANTASNPTLFQYSTNNGSTWNNLGTVPNTAGTTCVRYLWASPPGTRVTVSLKES